MVKTPTCPACGAKFSHDRQLLKCKKCGVTDEVIDMGPSAIRKWKQGKLKKADPPAKEFSFGASAGRKHNKHGRKGVKRVA